MELFGVSHIFGFVLLGSQSKVGNVNQVEGKY